MENKTGFQLQLGMNTEPSPNCPTLVVPCAQVYDVSSCTCLHQGPCPISAGGATLTWLGFTDEGLLATGDSRGMLRIR